jgi:hypothetical protein
MDYKKLTKKELEKLKSFRIKRMNEFQMKADAYSRLISEVNNEQVDRLMKSLRKKK